MTKKIVNLDIEGIALEATEHRAATKPGPRPDRKGGRGKAPALGSDVVRITFLLKPPTIRAIKARAAEEGLTPSQVVTSLVEKRGQR